MTGIAHLAIDFLKGEGKALPDCVWPYLCRTICGFERDLRNLGIETIPVTSVSRPDVEPGIGPFREIEASLALKSGISLQNSARMFSTAVNPEQVIAVKTGYSACTQPMLNYLSRKKVDTLVLTGVWEGPHSDPKCCVTASALDFVRNGFRVIIVENGTNIVLRPNGGHGVTRDQRVAANRFYGIETLSIPAILKMAWQQQAFA